MDCGTCTWTGGFKAVGKDSKSAIKVWELCQRYEEAGAFGVEIEVVPPEVTAEVPKRTSLFLVSMGGGKCGDCQYLFASDVLGYNTGHVPRHAKKYADLSTEYSRVQDIRVNAFRSFVADVQSGAWPTPEYLVKAPKAELDAFRKQLSG